MLLDRTNRGPALDFADSLAAGEFDRHLRRMRPVHRRRRDALVSARLELGARLVADAVRA